MKPATLRQLAGWSGATLVRGDESLLCTGVSTDTRSIRRGDLFAALRGGRFDAHDFLADAVKAGAGAVLVERDPGVEVTGGAGVLLAPDALKALQDMARGFRLALNPHVIGITGSAGKTSTKDMLTAVLSKQFRTQSTPGNFNNHIGVPLTLFRLEEDTGLLVCEMGMNHRGEIAVLIDIARPDAAVVTNVGTAHIENLGSREAIAEEKGDLPAGVDASGFVVLNADDAFTPVIAARCRARVMLAGIGGGEVRGHILHAEEGGSTIRVGHGGSAVETFLPVAGEHMVRNALLAVAAGIGYGMDLDTAASALRDLKLTGGRLQPRRIGGILFLDDSYNANPESMAAALLTFQSLSVPGKKVAVLGRMGELGPHAPAEHALLGKRVAQAGMDFLCTVGDGSQAIGENAAGVESRHFADHASCAGFLHGLLAPGDAVLVKGSRSAAMEKIINLFPSAS